MKTILKENEIIQIPYSLETEYDYLISGDTHRGITHYKAVDAKGEVAVGGRFDKGLSTGNSTNKQLVVQGAIDLLTDGGYILVKDLELPTGLSYGSNILICVNYQGTRTYYRDNAFLREEGSIAAFSGLPLKEVDYIVVFNTPYFEAIDGVNGTIAYQEDSQDAVLTDIVGVLSSGSILLKGIQYDYSVSIPENVSIIESYQGNLKQFINPLNSNGAPYKVTFDGTKYYAKDSKGYIVSINTNLLTLIQATIALLTSGRTSKEKVTVEGDVTLTGSIYAPAYTVLDFTGKVTLSNDFFTTASKAVVYAWEVNDVEVYIDTIDFNGANQGSAGYPWQQLQGIYFYNTTRFKGKIGYAFNGILPDTATSQEVVAINVSYSTLTDSKGEIKIGNAEDLQFGAFYLNSVENLDIYCGDLTAMDDAFYMTACYNITVFGGKVEGCLDSGTDIENSTAIFFIGTKFVNPAFGTLGNVTTTFATAFGAAANSEVFLIGCSLVVKDSASALQTHILLAGSSVVHFTNCYLEGDGTTTAYMTNGSNKGTLLFDNCRFKYVYGFNYSGSLGMYVSINGGSLDEVGTPLQGNAYKLTASYPQSVNDSLLIKDVAGYNPINSISNPYPATTGTLTNASKAQAYPTSGVVYTVDITPKTIIVGGGTISDIAINGVYTGLTKGVFHLRVGEQIIVAWTVQPTINNVACD